MVSTPSRWTNGLRWSLNKQIKTKKKKGGSKSRYVVDYFEERFQTEF